MSDPTNVDRAEWARAGVRAYFAETRPNGLYQESYGPKNPEGGGFIFEVVGDMICDLFHLAAESDVGPDALVVQARMHFDAETGGED